MCLAALYQLYLNQDSSTVVIADQIERIEPFLRTDGMSPELFQDVQNMLHSHGFSGDDCAVMLQLLVQLVSWTCKRLDYAQALLAAYRAHGMQ